VKRRVVDVEDDYDCPSRQVTYLFNTVLLYYTYMLMNIVFSGVSLIRSRSSSNFGAKGHLKLEEFKTSSMISYYI
jgi:hypothetical protein